MTRPRPHHRSPESAPGACASAPTCERRPTSAGAVESDVDEPDRDPLLLSVPAAARMLSLGRTTVYTLIASGELETISIGRCRRVPRAAIEAFVEQRSVAAALYGRS